MAKVSADNIFIASRGDGSSSVGNGNSISGHSNNSNNNNSNKTKKESLDWLEQEVSHVSIEVLEKIIHEAVELFEKAELYELAPYALKVMISSYEREYEHRKLAELYQKMAKIHSKVQEYNDSGKRV